MPDNLFPAFPTLYTPEDSKRQKELEVQKKAIDKIYPPNKGFEEVFAEKSQVEQDARKLFSTMPIVSDIAKAIAPADWGLQFGFTPEQLREYNDQLEVEYSGLLRKQRVTGIVDTIKRDMTRAALSGKPYPDMSKLDDYFPELKDFTPEEKRYIAEFGSRLGTSSPEDIMSGKTTGEAPKVSSNDVYNWMGQNPQIDPRFILSTVAFSKNSEEISQALQYAYPPKVTPEDAMRKKLAGMQWELDTRKFKNGIPQKTDNETAIQKVHEKIAADGTSFALVDDATGNKIPGMLRPDNYITVDGVPTGYYDKTNSKVVPISTKGIPIMSKEAEDQANRDILGGLSLWAEEVYKGAMPSLENAWQSALDYMFFTKPVIEMGKPGWQKALEAGIPPLSFITDAVSGTATMTEGKKPVTKPVEKTWEWNGQKELYDNTKAYLSEQQANRKLIHDQWVAEHPEFTPKQKYIEADWSNLGELAADPGFWGYTFGTIAGSMLPSLAATIGVTAATGGNIFLGAAAGIAIMHPMNVQSNYEDLKASGADDEEAAVLANQAGVLQGMLEYIPNLIGLKLINPVITKVFNKNITGGLLKQFNLFKVAGLTVADWAAETGTEGIQQVIQNAAVKTVDETRDLMEGVPQTIITSAFGMLPIAIFGGASNYVATRRNLPKSTLTKLDTESKRYQETGLSKNTADMKAVLDHLNTEKGKSEFDQADLKRRQEIPTVFEMLSKRDELSKDLKQIEKDIPINDKRIEAAQKKITKMKETSDPGLAKQEKLLENLLGYRKTLETMKAESTVAYNRLVRLSKIQPESRLPNVFLKATEDDITRMEKQLENQKLVVEKAQKGFEQTIPSEAILKLPKTGKEELETLVDMSVATPDMVKAVTTLRDELRVAVDLKYAIEGIKGFLTKAKAYSNEPSATKALPVPDILDEIHRIETNPKMKPAFEAWAKYCAEMEVYREKMEDFIHYEAADKASGVVSKNKPPVQPIVVQSPILPIIERFGTDVNDISFHADITPELRESVKNTILTLPIKAIVSIRSIGIDPNLLPAAIYRMDDQSITFRTVALVGNKYTLVHEISHNIIQEMRLSGGNYQAFAIKLGAAINVTPKYLLSLIGKTSEGRTLGITKAGWNVADNQMTTEDKRVFMENQGRILEAYINNPVELHQNAPSIYEVYREYFPKKNIIENMSMPEMEGIYGSPPPAQVNPDRIPRKKPIEAELQDANVALNTQPDFAAFIKLSPKVKAVFANGMAKFNDLHSRYSTATAVDQKVIETEFAALARATGIPKSELLSRTWGYLTRVQQSMVATAFIPDGSIEMTNHVFLDMEECMETYQEQVPLPFLPIYRRVQLSTSAAEVLKNRILKEWESDQYIAPLLKDEVALKRVEDAILSKDTSLKVPYPVDITSAEEYLVKWLEDGFKDYEPKVRYLRIESITSNTLENFKLEFPDAVDLGLESELEQAIRLKDWGMATQDYNPLWLACKTWTWGVKKSGYAPMLVAKPSLDVIRKSLAATRGKGRLMSRETISFKTNDKNIAQRHLTYVEQMAILWDLAPDLNYFDDMWTLAAPKFKNFGTLENELKLWVATAQGIPTYSSTATKTLFGIRRVAMSSYFLNPRLALRNAPQGLILGLDRSETLRLIVQPVRPGLKQIARTYFDEYVSELGGLRTDYLLQDETLPPVIAQLVTLSDKLSLFSKSEYYPRMLTFLAQLNKADRAMQELLLYAQNRQVNPPTPNEFKKVISKYIIDSGATHLKDIEIAYLLSNYVSQYNGYTDLGTEGLREVRNSDMASMYVAQRSTDQVHFKYNLMQKALAEMGTDGRIIWNLMVYPRSYAQRLVYDAKLMLDYKESLLAAANGLQKLIGTETDPVKDVDYAKNRAAWKDVLLLASCSLFYGWIYEQFSGEEENPYDMIANIFGWQVGGVFMSTNTAAFDLVGSLVTIVNPATPKSLRDIEASAFPATLRKVTGMIPGFPHLVGLIDVLLGVDGCDKQAIRELRSVLDKEYTPAKMEQIERNAFDMFMKVVFVRKTPTPVEIKQDRKKLQEGFAMLGTLDAKGSVYTTEQYGNLIASVIKGKSAQSIQDIIPKPSIVTFYHEYQKDTTEYEKIPDASAKERANWRMTHLEAEAMMMFWGKFDVSVFKSSPVQYKQVQDLVKLWVARFGVPESGLPKANWQTPLSVK